MAMIPGPPAPPNCCASSSRSSAKCSLCPRDGRQRPRVGGAVTVLSQHFLPCGRPHPDGRMRRAGVRRSGRQSAAARRRGRQDRSIAPSARRRQTARRSQPQAGRAEPEPGHGSRDRLQRGRDTRASASWRANWVCMSILTAPVSPMHWLRCACRPSGLPGRPALTCCAWAGPRTVWPPEMSSCFSTATWPASSSIDGSKPAICSPRCGFWRRPGWQAVGIRRLVAQRRTR